MVLFKNNIKHGFNNLQHTRDFQFKNYADLDYLL